MSTTVTYKGATLTTASNQTKTLNTSGTWLEDNITITDVTTTPALITKNITANGTYNASSDNADGYSSVTVNVPTGGGGGVSGVAKGTVTIASNITTTTTTPITTISDIGFTPTKFVFFKDVKTQTNNYVHYALCADIDGLWLRSVARYAGQNATLTASNVYTIWTTNTTGYLYYNGGTINYRTSSSYILGAGTYTWYAIQ